MKADNSKVVIKKSVIEQALCALELCAHPKVEYKVDQLEMANDALRRMKSNAQYALSQLWSEAPAESRSKFKMPE